MPDATLDPQRDRTIGFGQLAESLGFLLRLGQLASFRDYFETLGHLDVRPGEISVLMLIDENPGIRQGVLARQLMIKRAHMTKMVRAMEGAGLISRTVPTDDRRAMELRLTETGVAHVAELRPPFLAHEARGAANLTAREDAELKRLLRKYLGLAAPEAS